MITNTNNKKKSKITNKIGISSKTNLMNEKLDKKNNTSMKNNIIGNNLLNNNNKLIKQNNFLNNLKNGNINKNLIIINNNIASKNNNNNSQNNHKNKIPNNDYKNILLRKERIKSSTVNRNTQFEFIESQQFIRNGNKFTLDTSLDCSVLGIYYNFIPGNNTCRIEIDGKAFAVPEISFDYDFSQCHIMVVNKWDAGETVNIKNNISVIFGNDQAGKEQADGFSGIALSG